MITLKFNVLKTQGKDIESWCLFNVYGHIWSSTAGQKTKPLKISSNHFQGDFFKVIIIQVGSIRICAPALPSNFVNKQSVCASKVDFKKLYLLSDLYVYIEQAVHCFLKSALSLGDNLAGSWDISRNLPISWTRNWDKLIFSVHFQNLDRESESSNISRDRLEHTDYLGPSQQGENCFLNQPGFNKPWAIHM